MHKKNKKDKVADAQLRAALKATEGWQLSEGETHQVEHFHRCPQCDVNIALELLQAAYPIVPDDGPLRIYKNQKVRDEIRQFLKEHGIIVSEKKLFDPHG